MEIPTLVAHRRTLIPILSFFFAFLYLGLIASDPFLLEDLFGVSPLNLPNIGFFRPFKVALPFVDRIPFGDRGIYFPTDHVILVPLFLAAGLLYLFKERGLRLIAFLSSCVLTFQLLSAVTQVLRLLFDRRGSEGAPLLMIVLGFVVVGGAAFLVLTILKQSSGKSSTTTIPSLWVRFVGYLIDLILLINVVFALRIETTGIIGRLHLVFLLVVFYFFFERIFYFTPGKILLGLRVQNADGSDPDEQAIFKRTFARFIPLEQLTFLTKSGGLHDTLSKTIVRKNDEPSSE